MPLLKSAQTPDAPATPAADPAVAALVAKGAAIMAKKAAVATGIPAKLSKFDERDRKILLQGAFQNALQSVGVVQHGGKTFADYLARVEEAANASVDYVLRNL